ncbi:glycerol transporter [Bifidobacterium ramosum]|uniref:Glycerol transporter n=2 Tax=Bifidobacterium ramosum TaxID=1798158 RepID=A0A6L4X2K5_9BIFI|nr:glycerol transporter [Bifidobacterium ramosum]NEG71067.1 glycerol transporter [Bifidobacterium ramosum]
MNDVVQDARRVSGDVQDEGTMAAPSLVARVLAELAGSFLICVSIYAMCAFGSSIYGANMAFVAVGTALVYAVVTAMLGGISGGQFNPAVTVASMLASKTRVIDGVAYIVAQVIGALAAAGVVRALMPTSDSIAVKVWLTPAVNGYDNGSVAYATINSVGISFGIVMAIVVEVVAGIIIVGTAMHATDEQGRPAADYALLMGAAYGVGAAITYPVTGAALNPARATGIAVFAQGQGLNTEPLGQLWVFWVCPVLAAAVVSLVLIVAQMAKDAVAKKRAANNALPADAEQGVDDVVEQVPVEPETSDATGSVEAEDAEVDDQQSDAQRDADEGVERH